MARARRPVSLAQQNLRWLAALFLGLELVTVVAALVFVLLPLARRSADDLSGLLVLSAQTWVELPADRRPDFEEELRTRHLLALRPGMAPPPDTGLRHGFYLLFLERALERRLGEPVFFASEAGPGGGEWLWTSVSTGGRPIGVGFAYARMQTHPFQALAVALLAGTLGVSLAAWWLARRIAEPVAALESAAAQLATGASPALLPETGPRELAHLAGHFNRMVLQVRELLDARTTLLAGVSHDLRTPLARMRLALEMLTLKPDPALLARLESDIGEMNGLIGQLLDLARGVAGEAAQRFELGPWLRERARLHADAAARARATVTLSCPEGLLVQAPPGLLDRVVDNLLGNAIRYAPGPIELRARPGAGKPASSVRISVLDRGPGIPPDQLAAVWRPFQRVEGSRSPQTGGYGLGLAIVRQLAQSQGWQPELAARDGGGLQASVDVPLAPAGG
jgi:two-component system osmolarity sensor histidine kinase EnvZ